MFIKRSLFNILISFASLRPTRDIQWPDISVVQIHDFLLNFILLNPIFQASPPSTQYQQRFWKWTIENMERILHESNTENDEFEIDSRMYDHYLSLNPSVPSVLCGRMLPRCPPENSFVTHYWRLESPEASKEEGFSTVDLSQYHTITLLESQRMIESGTTGLRTWFASYILAQHLVQFPGKRSLFVYFGGNPNYVVKELIKGQRVLELGSGVGFLGSVIAALQVYRNENNVSGSLYLTDINEDVLSRCQENIQIPSNLSSKHNNLHVHCFDWTALSDQDRQATAKSFLLDDVRPDIMLGADIVFDPSLIPDLVSVLKLVLSPRNCSANNKPFALVALTIRNQTTMASFLNQVEGSSLRIAEIPVEPHHLRLWEGVDAYSANNVNVKLYRLSA